MPTSPSQTWLGQWMISSTVLPSCHPIIIPLLSFQPNVIILILSYYHPGYILVVSCVIYHPTYYNTPPPLSQASQAVIIHCSIVPLHIQILTQLHVHDTYEQSSINTHKCITYIQYIQIHQTRQCERMALHGA